MKKGSLLRSACLPACPPARKVRANTSSSITSSLGGGEEGPFEELLVRAASDVLNKCYPCVYFSFVGANNGVEEEGSGLGARRSLRRGCERATFSKRRSGAAQVHW